MLFGDFLLLEGWEEDWAIVVFPWSLDNSFQAVHSLYADAWVKRLKEIGVDFDSLHCLWDHFVHFFWVQPLDFLKVYWHLGEDYSHCFCWMGCCWADLLMQHFDFDFVCYCWKDWQVQPVCFAGFVDPTDLFVELQLPDWVDLAQPAFFEPILKEEEGKCHLLEVCFWKAHSQWIFCFMNLEVDLQNWSLPDHYWFCQQ